MKWYLNQFCHKFELTPQIYATVFKYNWVILNLYIRALIYMSVRTLPLLTNKNSSENKQVRSKKKHTNNILI